MGEKLKSVICFFCVIPTILVISTVFIIDNTIPQGIVVGQAFWFYKVMVFASLAVLMSYLINKKQIDFSFIDFLLFSFILSGIGITWLNAEEITPRIVMLLSILSLYFLFRISINQDKGTFPLLTASFVLTGLIEAVWGLKQLYGFSSSQHSLFRTTGSFYNSGPYAGYLAIIAPIALHYCIKHYDSIHDKLELRHWPRYSMLVLSAVTLTLITLILPSTGSRASWLAAALGCAVVIVLEQRQALSWITKNVVRRIFYFFIGFIFLGFALYALYTFKKDSADGRVLIWKNTIEQIKDNPTGVGVGFYSGSYGKYQAEHFKNNGGTDEEKMIAGSPEYAFNEYLQIAAEFGVISFLLFVAIIVLTIVFAVKNARNGPLGGLVALLVFAGMSYPFSLLPFIISFTLLVVLCTYPTEDKTENNKRITIPTMVLLASVIAVCVMIHVITETSRLYRSYQSWGNARYLYHAKAYKSANEIYSKEYHNLRTNVEYLFEYGQILSNLGEYSKSNAVLQRASKLSSDPMIYNITGKNHQSLGEYNKAVEYFTRATNMVPHKLYPYYLLTQLYIENNDMSKAEETARKLLSIHIKIPSPATKQIKDEMRSFLDILNKKELSKN